MDFFELLSQLYLFKRAADFCRSKLVLNPFLWWDFRNTFAPFSIYFFRLNEVLFFGKRSRKALHFIHIGKCAGSSVRNKVLASEIMSQYSRLLVTHVARPIYSSRDDYLFVLRAPMLRSLSAFNWRFHLVVETGEQSKRFRGEKDILCKYRTLNNLAESLYTKEGRLNKQASRDYNSIHHLRESISFYITPQFFDLNPQQLIGVLCQNNLQEDCAKVLGVFDLPRLNDHGGDFSGAIEKSLSPSARYNLRRFLVDEYAVISKLYSMGHLSDANFSFLMKN